MEKERKDYQKSLKRVIYGKQSLNKAFFEKSPQVKRSRDFARFEKQKAFNVKSNCLTPNSSARVCRTVIQHAINCGPTSGFKRATFDTFSFGKKSTTQQIRPQISLSLSAVLKTSHRKLSGNRSSTLLSFTPSFAIYLNAIRILLKGSERRIRRLSTRSKSLTCDHRQVFFPTLVFLFSISISRSLAFWS